MIPERRVKLTPDACDTGYFQWVPAAYPGDQERHLSGADF
jgi:hypothetical protein